MPPLLQTRHIAKAIPGEPGKFALADAHLAIWPGEFVAIVGPSGSGKTTLLSMLGLLARPDSGEYILMGRVTNTLPEAERNQLRATQIGFVFQNSFVISQDTVSENVALPLRIRGIIPEQSTPLVDAALKRVGLLQLRGRLAGELSGGEKQRVAVARALVTGPELLLADEPTGALDSQNSARLIELLRSINAAGTTVVVVTHDPLVANAADRQITLNDGRAESGPTAPPPSAERPDPPSQDDVRSEGTTWRRLRFAAEAAWVDVVSRPARSVWVVLAYTLGVAALVAALGLTNSARGTVVSRLTAAGSDMVRVFPPGDERVGSFDPTTQGGPLQRIRGLPGVADAAPVRSYPTATNLITRHAGAEARFEGRIYVTTANYLQIHRLHPRSGNSWMLDNPWNGPVAVLGSGAGQSLSVAGAEPGVAIDVNGRAIPVVATLESVDDAVFDNAVYLSTGALPLLGQSADQVIEVQTVVGYAEPVAAAIPALLDPVSPGKYKVSSVAQLRTLQSAISTDLARLLQVLGIVIILLSTATAAISLMLSVRAQAPQIAIRRTVGASRIAIWLQYTLEGVLIGLLGGAFGTAVGVAVAWAVAVSNSEVVSLGLPVAVLGLGVSLVGGVVSSTYPALHAARQDPAVILRRL